MSHRLIYVNADDTVAIGSFGPDLQALMGTGRIHPSQIEREIAKGLIRGVKGESENQADVDAFATDWPAFLASRIGTPREVVMRAFIEGLAHGGLTVDVAIERIRAKDQPASAVRVFKKDDSLLPDYTFRNAWECHDESIDINMPKARGIHMDRIRVVRNAELVKLDLASLRAIEAGDTDAQATIATEKQVLRDIPATFDLTTDTPAQLSAKWPAELPDRE